MTAPQASLLVLPVERDPRTQALNDLREKSRSSAYFSDDPPELAQAWKAYVDAYRRDAAKPKPKGERRVAISNDTAMAWSAYWQTVEYFARRKAHPFENLDPYSGKPSITDPMED